MMNMESGIRASLSILATGTVWIGGCATASWTQWGGPNRDFVVQSAKVADQWPEEGPTKVWSRALGSGYSAILARNGRLYTMYKDEKQDVVVALQESDGDTIWEHRYDTKIYEGQVEQFGLGPSATPLLVGDRLITASFDSQIRGLNANSGELIWKMDLVEELGGVKLKFGYANSPLAYNGTVIIPVGGDQNAVVAVDPADGSIVWRSEPGDVSYAAPVIINVDGQDQLVYFSAEEVVGMNPTNGAILWSHPCVNRYKNNCSQALWLPSENLLWAATQLEGATRVVRLTRDGDNTNVEEIWHNDDVKIFHWNAVRNGNHVYASIGGNVTFLAAVDFRTGEIKWRERGFHKAQMVAADGKIIFVDENGKLVLARMTPEKCEILSQVELLEKVAWTTPTLVGSRLYVRDNATIMALDVG